MLWRLAVNGVPAAGGHDISQAGPCPCGWAGPRQGSPPPQPAHVWREHCFWSFEEAKDVVHQLQEILQLGAPLARDSVWLVRAPPRVHQCVWEPVCAAALDAMAFGRRICGQCI